ncbi:hypothetical protein JCM8547_008044 [Rhodosporidiobolus lusitaniae]
MCYASGERYSEKEAEAAQKAYDTVWGERCAPRDRGRLLNKIADLFDEHKEQLASIEALDNGKAFAIAKGFDVSEAANCLRYYAGWADKDHGKVIEVHDQKLAFTKHEPIGVVGQIIPCTFVFFQPAQSSN